MPAVVKILTLHPGGKQGVNILQRRYDLIREKPSTAK